jgi:putative protease
MGAKNFDLKDLNKIAKICHKNKVKAYLALNTIVYQNETDRLKRIIKKAKSSGIDAVIAWDFSVISEANKINLPIHISTQASISNYEALKSLKKQFKNITQVILARELSLEQIKDIIKRIKKDNLGVKIEVFVHGAMCVSVSGRCFLSQEIFGKSANRGECLQPCRRKYLIRDIEENHELELGEEYIMSPKDLCTLPFLDKLAKAGIYSFKIEGRNRSPEYVKTVTEVYREAIDNNNNKADKNKMLEKLKKVYNRDFSSGFYLGKPINEWCKAYGNKSKFKKEYIGTVKNYYSKIGVAEVHLKSLGLNIGDAIIFQGNKTGVFEQKVRFMHINGNPVESAKIGSRVGIKTDKNVRENDKVFIVKC